METTSVRWRWLLVAAVAPIAWGSTYFVTRQLLPADLPLWGAVLRALPAGILLLVVARRRPRGAWWWRSAVLGVLNVGAFFILVYVAAQLLPSSIAATIMALSAIAMALIAWPLLQQRPRVVSLLGGVMGFAGVCTMLATDAAALNPWGVTASLAAMAMSSVGFLLARRWATDESPIAVTAWQLVAGGLLVLPVAALVEGPPPALDPPTAIGFLYVTVIATAVANVAWLVALRTLPAATVGLVGLLNPVTGVALGVLIAFEPFGPRQVLGIALVLAGVLLGQWQPRRPAARLTMEGYVQPRDRDQLPR